MPKNAVQLRALEDFLGTCTQSSSITCNVKANDVKKLKKDMKVQTIHGRLNDGGPSDVISTKGDSAFFCAKPGVSVAGVHRTITEWVGTNKWHVETVVAEHTLECSPFYADEETSNFVVFFAISPKPIRVNSLSGCSLPGEHGSGFSVFGSWNNLDESPPQSTVYDRCRRQQPLHGKSLSTLKDALQLVKDQRQLINATYTPFLVY
jgi:hypothetical protein